MSACESSPCWPTASCASATAGGAEPHPAERVPAAERSQERGDRRVAQTRDVDVLQAHASGGPALRSPARNARSRLRRAGGPEERRGAPAHGSRPGGVPMSAPMEQPGLARRLVAEGLGTALLLATVVGSGIMGERLAGGNLAIALLANALATGAGLLALILMLGPISGARVNPEVLAVMREVGIALSSARPRKLTAELAQGASLLVTMGCGDECPVVPGARRDDWPLPDPKGQPLGYVRQIRDEIKQRVGALVSAERWGL